jgi:hypothetical protein
MNRRRLNRYYNRFDLEERLRLLLAAWSRGDEPEENRLVASAPAIRIRMKEFAPAMQAFKNIALLTFIELADHASAFFQAWALADRDDDRADRWSLRARGFGYLLRSKWLAWKAFSADWHADPELLWNGLPGLERLRSAIALAEEQSRNDPELMTYLHSGTGDAGPITPEWILEQTHQLFESHVQDLMV